MNITNAIKSFKAERLSSLEPSTVTNWNTSFRFLLDIANCNTVKDIKLKADMFESPVLSGPTKKRMYGHIDSFLEYCVEKEWLSVHPYAIGHVKKPKGSSIHKNTAPERQLNLIQDALGGAYRAIFLILRYTGLRIGELLDNGRRSHRKPIFRGDRIEVYSQKLKEVESQLLPSNHGVAELCRQYANADGTLEFHGVTACDFRIVLREANEGVYKNEMGSQSPDYGFLPVFTPHECRRWFGDMVYGKLSLKHAQNAMRHRKQSTTERYYVHTQTDKLKKEAADAI